MQNMNDHIIRYIDVLIERNKARVNPKWVNEFVCNFQSDDELSLQKILKKLEWSLVKIDDKPRTHDFPMLAWNDDYGWCIAEYLTSEFSILFTNSGGQIEAEWDKFNLWTVIFPEVQNRSVPLKAIDIFWSSMMRQKSTFFEAWVATVVINIIALVTSIYSMQVYDRVIPRSGYDTLVVLTIGVFIALLIDILMRVTRANIIDRAAGKIDCEVSEYFYSRMQAVRLDARPRAIGTLAAQIRSTDQVRAILSSSSLFVIADLPFALFFILVIWTIGSIVAAIPSIAFLLSMLLAIVTSFLIAKDASSTQVNGNKKNGRLVEALDSAETIKANFGGWEMVANWTRLSEEVQENDLRVKRWSSIANSGFLLIQQSSYVGVVCLGAFLVATGKMTMGGLIACSILNGRVNGPLISALPNLIVQWSYARSSLEMLGALLSLPSDQPESKIMIRHKNLQGDFYLENVNFSYEGSRQRLNIPSLKIEKGQAVGVIGPVGSGKSTLLKLVSGLYAPQEGVILLDGMDISQIAEEDLRRQICYLPQEYKLITGTLRDNLTLGLSNIDDEQLIDAASNSGLLSIIKEHPLGLNLPISEGGQGLSGGQKALVGLTRIFLIKPRMLILDEPTASLDQETERKVLHQIIKNLDADCTLIFATHKLQLVGLAKRLLVVVDGRIIMDGGSETIMEKLRLKNHDEISRVKASNPVVVNHGSQ